MVSVLGWPRAIARRAAPLVVGLGAGHLSVALVRAGVLGARSSWAGSLSSCWAEGPRISPAHHDVVVVTPSAPSTSRLAIVFLRVGALAFGGLGPTIALIEREFVDRTNTLTRADIAEALTHTKLLPGSTVVQVVAYLGWRLRGWPGSAIATTCFILPSALLMLALAYGYAHVAATPAAIAARRGVLAVVIALLLGTMVRLSAQLLKTRRARAFAIGAFAVVALLPNASPWIVLAAGIAGLVVHRGPR